MASVSAEPLAIVGEPDGGVVILGAGEEQIPLPVVLEERQWPFMALHQDRPHGSSALSPPTPSIEPASRYSERNLIGTLGFVMFLTYMNRT